MRTEVDMMDLVLDLVNLNSNINFWLLLMRRLLNVNLVDGLNQTIVELAITSSRGMKTFQITSTYFFTPSYTTRPNSF